MESRARSIFLNTAGLMLTLFSALVSAQDSADQPPQVIEPDVERRDLDVGEIDTENFELTGFVGLMSVEDFETNAVYGGRLAYHMSENLFAEATYGATEVGQTSAERVLGFTFFDDRNLSYYDLSLGWNILPGEAFYRDRKAFNSSFYLIGGLGSTKFADDSSFTVNFGFGYKILLNDSFAVRIDARNYLLDVDIQGLKKTLNNMQGTINFSWFF